MALGMAPERTQVEADMAAPDHTLNRSYIDWAAILGGTVVATAIGLIFTTFGAALGLSAISAEVGEGSGMLGLILTGLWMVVTLIASYAAGGYIAGRMRRRVDQASIDEVATRDGVNGLVVWGAGMVIAAMVIGNVVSSTVSAAGSVADAAVTATGSALGGVVEGAATLLPDDPMIAVTDALTRPAQIDPATADRAELARQAASILGTAAMSGEVSDADRAYLIGATTTLTGLPPAEVEARVDQAITAAIQARDTATSLAAEAEQAAINAAEIARKSAVLTGFLLAAASLIAAAAAVVGAVKGGEHRDKGTIFGGFSYRS
jgi:hypothetical protein